MTKDEAMIAMFLSKELEDAIVEYGSEMSNLGTIDILTLVAKALADARDEAYGECQILARSAERHWEDMASTSPHATKESLDLVSAKRDEARRLGDGIDRLATMKKGA